MCLTIPGKIKSIKNGIAIVENGERAEQIELGIVIDARVGDWVLHATNRAVRLIDEQEAREIIELLEDNYQPVDIKALPFEYKKIVSKIRNSIRQPADEIRNNGKITKKQETRNKQISNDKFEIPNEMPNVKNEDGQEFKIKDRDVIARSNRRSNLNDRLPRLEQASMARNDEQIPIERSVNLRKSDLEYLLNLKGKNNQEAFYSEANVLRKDKIKDFVCIHGIVEFSNYCKNNCLYCGIGQKANIRRYRMNTNEIYRAVKTAVEDEGYKLVVLQSGEDEYYRDEDIVRLIERIKKDLRVFIFISVGERSHDFYRRAFEAGASGSLFRFETSNPDLYRIMHPNHDLASRLESLQMQIELGYYVASGGLIGLPGQTVGDLADDLQLVAKLGVPMLSSGPWVPSGNSPLGQDERLKVKGKSGLPINSKYEVPTSLAGRRNSKQIQNSICKILYDECHSEEPRNLQINSEDSSQNTQNDNYLSNIGGIGNETVEQWSDDERLRLTLNYIAVARFMMPEIKIPITTALETLDPESGRHKGLLAGANALMFNITPEKYRADYNLYDHKYIEREKVWQKYGLFKGEESYEMLEERLKI